MQKEVKFHSLLSSQYLRRKSVIVRPTIDCKNLLTKARTS
jgi:hypothetical protein